MWNERIKFFVPQIKDDFHFADFQKPLGKYFLTFPVSSFIQI
jgi:hypothetical protein